MIYGQSDVICVGPVRQGSGGWSDRCYLCGLIGQPNGLTIGFCLESVLGCLFEYLRLLHLYYFKMITIRMYYCCVLMSRQIVKKNVLGYGFLFDSCVVVS